MTTVPTTTQLPATTTVPKTNQPPMTTAVPATTQLPTATTVRTTQTDMTTTIPPTTQLRTTPTVLTTTEIPTATTVPITTQPLTTTTLPATNQPLMTTTVPTTTHSLTTTTAATTMQPITPGTNLCAQRQDGIHVYNCTSYFVCCRNQVQKLQTCPPGYVYHANSKYCVEEVVYPCDRGTLITCHITFAPSVISCFIYFAVVSYKEYGAGCKIGFISLKLKNFLVYFLRPFKANLPIFTPGNVFFRECKKGILARNGLELYVPKYCGSYLNIRCFQTLVYNIHHRHNFTTVKFCPNSSEFTEILHSKSRL